jgi:hypothetical protein
MRFVVGHRALGRRAFPFVTAAILLGLVCGTAGAVTLPQTSVSDTPNDWGTGLTVTWTAAAPPESVAGYELWRRTVEPGRSAVIPEPGGGSALSEALAAAGWEKISTPGRADTSFTDNGLTPRILYAYALLTKTASGDLASAPTAPRAPRKQILSTNRINILVAVALFIAVVLWLVARARQGAKLFVRKIAGLEAVEEAVGRSTEMGRPILYVPGLDPMDEVATVAAIDILGQVAKKAAEYETRLMVPNRDPIVMAVAQQVVRESYSAVGKPHLYREEDIFYVTYSQFGFAAAVAGLMIRERPATNFFIGHFYAESLVLAETGNSTGAIQIAGTDSDAQLPFFITSCDYTLIGEELYAGAVYLSRQPLVLGTLKSQDYAKVVLIAAMIVGIVLSAVSPEAAQAFRAMFK